MCCVHLHVYVSVDMCTHEICMYCICASPGVRVHMQNESMCDPKCVPSVYICMWVGVHSHRGMHLCSYSAGVGGAACRWGLCVIVSAVVCGVHG